MQLTKEQVRHTWDSDRRKNRQKMILAAAVTAFIFLLCLCFRHSAYLYDRKFVPGEYYRSYILGIRLLFGRIFNLPCYARKDELIALIGENFYNGAFYRLKTIVMAGVAGAGLSIAGAVFQTIYKNPMASPNMLGATAGVKLGNILMIVLFSTQALELVTLRYKYCYLLTAICVVGVLLLGKFSGDKRGNFSVMEMVMAGSVITQGLNVFTMYYMYNLTDEDLQLYQEITMGTYTNVDGLSFGIFCTAMALGLIPMILLRYRFNVTAMEFTEAQAAGVNPVPIRLIGQICAVILVTAAMIHCGDTGMITLVIPFLVRKVVGADFRKVMVYSGLVGACLLMVCRLLTSFWVIDDVEIPVTFIINICLTPIFMIIVARQRRDRV